MSKATVHNTPTRRASVSGIAAVGFSAKVNRPASADGRDPTHPDADLLEICAKFEALGSELQAAYRRDIPDDDPHLVNMENRQFNLIGPICALRATTLEGMAARARCTMVWRTEINPEADAIGEGEDGYDPDKMLWAALLRDLVAGQHGPAIGSSPAIARPGIPPLVPPTLVAAGPDYSEGAMMALRRQIFGLSESPDDPDGEVMASLINATALAPARTLGDVLAGLLAAAFQADRIAHNDLTEFHAAETGRMVVETLSAILPVAAGICGIRLEDVENEYMLRRYRAFARHECRDGIVNQGEY